MPTSPGTHQPPTGPVDVIYTRPGGHVDTTCTTHGAGLAQTLVDLLVAELVADHDAHPRVATCRHQVAP